VKTKYVKMDFSRLLAFMRKFGIDKEYTISLDGEETRKVDGRTIFVVPIHKFLLDTSRSF